MVAMQNRNCRAVPHISHPFVFISQSKTQVIPDDPSKVKAREAPLVEVAGPLLAYLSELLAAVRFSAERDAPPSPAPTNASEGDLLLHDVEAEWLDYTGGDDDDSGGEESVRSVGGGGGGGVRGWVGSSVGRRRVGGGGTFGQGGGGVGVCVCPGG